MAGGVKWEHSHRMIAEFIGLLIIVMAVWTQRVESRKVDARAGLDSIGRGHRPGSSGRHYRAEFSAVVHLHGARHAGADDLLHRRRDGTVHQPLLAAGLRARRRTGLWPSTPALTAIAAACVWVQLILGAAFRHYGMKLLPHLIGACVVTAVVCWTVVRVLTRYGSVDHLRKPAQLLLALLMIQLGLGFCAYLTRMTFGHNAVQPWQIMVVSTVSHVAWGALVLAASVVLAIQSRRMIDVHSTESAAHRVHGKAVIA
jgi:heme A synthase